MLSVVLVDDHPVFRLGVRYMLEGQGDLKVVAEADSAGTARRVLRETHPDLLVLDLVLGDGSGLEILDELPALSPGTRTLVVSMLDELLYAERCLRAGACGYLMKSEAAREITTALQQIAAGDIYLGHTATRRILRKLAAGTPGTADPVEVLTNRELEVFQLLGSGKRTSEIAQDLAISPKTVESHQAKLKRKLGVSNATELLRVAMDWAQHGGRLEGT